MVGPVVAVVAVVLAVEVVGHPVVEELEADGKAGLDFN